MQTFSPRQSRAARALLDMTQAQLAEASGLSIRTVTNFEKEQNTAVPAVVEALQKTLEASGVHFIPGGVTLKPLPHYEHSIGHDITFAVPSLRLVSAHLQWVPDYDPRHKGELAFCLTAIDWDGNYLMDPTAISIALKAYPILQEVIDLPQTPRTEYVEKLLEYCDRIGFHLSDEEREKARAAVRRNIGR